MKREFRHSVKFAALAAALLGLAGTARAQFTAPPPGFTPADTPVAGNTLWHALGVPQGFRKIEDATVNANGNNPADERIPPLKRIGDPANAQSQNPAIKKAAEIKQEEDMKQQKVKAIKYLATIGCCSYKGVIDALADALEDPTEEVRFEAAQAIVDLVCYNSAPCVNKPDEGDPCKHSFKHEDDGAPGCLKKCLDKLKHCAHLDKKEEKHKQCKLKEASEEAKCACGDAGATGCGCNKCGGCCSEELTKKLAERAYGRDDKGCWLEPSERVRAMVNQALHCCCPGTGPEGPSPEGPINPIEKPIEVPRVPDRTPESVPPVRPEVPGPISPPPPALPLPPQASMAPSHGPAMAQKPAVMVKSADGKWIPLQTSKTEAPRAAQRPQIVNVPAADPRGGAPSFLAPMPAVRSLATGRAANDQMVDVADALLPAPPADFIASADGHISAPATKRMAVTQISSQIDPANRATVAKPAVANTATTPVPMAASPASPAPTASVMAESNLPATEGQAVYGKIVELDPRSRSVLLEFARGSEPPVGTAISAHHAYLLGVSEIGLLEVITSRPGTVVAQPAGTLSLGKMSQGDEVVYRRAGR